ncbi:MAG: BON domain-containing protein [Acidobacteriota bacterium]
MKQWKTSFGAAIALAVTLAVLPSANARTGPQTVDLTKQFLSSGAQVDGLRATEIGGIVLLRGETDDPAKAEAATTLAHTLGYARVANLIRIVDPPDDARIERTAERRLATRTLDGCNFVVDSNGGVVTVAGHVRYELQKDVAMSILRKIDGVREVRSSIQR